MALEVPTMEQAGLISVIFSVGGFWFNSYLAEPPKRLKNTNNDNINPPKYDNNDEYNSDIDCESDDYENDHNHRPRKW